MKVILFGATGMVGKGVLRECLLDPAVEQVLSIVRSPTGVTHAKLHELPHRDFNDYSVIESKLAGYDAAFFCLGVSAAGMTEEEYRAITYDYTLAAANTLARLNPQMTFIYVSGVGTDSTERGRMMWARVKGRTENELLKLPFKAAYMFRPGAIQAMNGERPKATASRVAYNLLGFMMTPARRLFPNHVTTTEIMGRAMIRAARDGAPKAILEPADINRLGAG
jgi:uncharacterized protein YbjT (DUF2867 family)